MGAALLAMGLQGCQEEEIITGQDNIFKLEATKALTTRTTTDEEGNVYWSQGDKLLVFGQNGSWGTLTLETEDAGKPEGTFSGIINGEIEDLKYAVYGDATRNFNTVSIDYTGYTYPNSNSPMKGVISNGKVGMEHLYGMVRLEILNFPKTESTLVLKGNGIAGTGVWNGITFTAESSSDEITVKIPAGKREATMIIDIPVFVSASTVNLTVELNGNPYKKSGETGSATSIKTKLQVGALNVSNMPKMEVKGNELTEATDWSDDVEDEDQLEDEDNDGTYLIMNAEDLAVFASMVNSGVSFKGKTVKLGANIDLLDKEWTPIGTGFGGTDGKYFMGTFDGQNYTVSNLFVSGTNNYVGLFGSTSDGAIRDLKINNATVSGASYVAAVAGLAYTTPITNVTVTGDVKIDATGQDVAVVTGYTYGDITDVTVAVNEGSYVKASSYFGGVVGYPGEGETVFTRVKSNIDVIGKTYMIGGITGIAQYGNKFIDCSCSGDVSLTEGDANSNNRWMRIGGIAGSWMEKAGYPVTLENCSYTGTLSSKKTDGTVATEFDNCNLVGRGCNYNDEGTLIINGKVIVFSADNLVSALEKDFDVLFNNNIKIDPPTMSNAYGATGINVKQGRTIDGNGYTLDINGAGGTWDSGICTSGGLIKNLTVTGAFRGIFIKKGEYNDIVKLENVTVDGTTYTISVDSGTGKGLEATNSTFKGWTSYAGTLGNAKFTNCYFGAGNGYNYSRPYAPTTYVNCKFEKGHVVDPRAAVTFENCTLDGVALTADNLSTLVTNLNNATVVK